MKKHAILIATLFSLTLAAAPTKISRKFILSDAALLEQAKVKILMRDEGTGLALAQVSSLQQSMILRKSHENGHCAGFELLPGEDFTQADFQKAVAQINTRKALDEKGMRAFHPLIKRDGVQDAIDAVDPLKIEDTVKFLSSFRTRYHLGATPNEHVTQFKAKVDALIATNPNLKATTSLIDHQSTPQKSLRLHIEGKTHPEEIVVLGAHLDSINMGMFGPTNGDAPGADDDGSGAASIFEALRVLIAQAPFDRSIEFFWYAGEEGGLLGSSEIANDYKSKSKKVVGVLQLDMTLYPGDGPGKIVSMTDYTAPELRAMLDDFNRMYLHVEIINDKCGYACSDHASWYKNGYPTVIPSEATFRKMNQNIHSENDRIDSGSSFEHAAIFGKIAVAFISHLGTP